MSAVREAVLSFLDAVVILQLESSLNSLLNRVLTALVFRFGLPWSSKKRQNTEALIFAVFLESRYE